MSSASACSSVIAGTPGDRGDVGDPVIGRREKQKPGPLFSKLKSRARVFQYAGVWCLCLDSVRGDFYTMNEVRTCQTPRLAKREYG